MYFDSPFCAARDVSRLQKHARQTRRHSYVPRDASRGRDCYPPHLLIVAMDTSARSTRNIPAEIPARITTYARKSANLVFEGVWPFSISHSLPKLSAHDERDDVIAGTDCAGRRLRQVAKGHRETHAGCDRKTLSFGATARGARDDAPPTRASDAFKSN